MTEDPHTSSEESPSQTTVDLGYQGNSALTADQGVAQVNLFTNVHRPGVRFKGRIKDPICFREAAAALYAIVSSDYRYVPKDRSAYLAYTRLKRESVGMGAWEAQQAYFDWLARNDPTSFMILDPVISVHPDQILFEVFSKDEGVYAKLGVSTQAFDAEDDPVYGTTNIDFSQHLYNGIQRMRSYRQTRISIGNDAVGLQIEGSSVLEKKIQVPDAWLRGFLQVQSAGTLPHDTIVLAPIDLYNMLRHLRLHRDVKGKRRGLMIELVPGEYPRLVLEPWEKIIETSEKIYTGNKSQVIRIWGRRRLMMLRRFLPFVRSIDVRLFGSGLPSFWILKAEEISLTLGLTGFTAGNWSRALSFDLLLPRKAEATEDLQAVGRRLQEVWFDNPKAISGATGLKGAALLKALQLGCQQGVIMYDIAEGVYRFRPLTGGPLNVKRLEFRNQNERRAHDLIHRRKAVSITSENRIYGTGVEVTGGVNVEEDRREYRPMILLNDDGQVSKAECTCSLYRKQGLKQGPCAHLIALRLTYAAAAARQRKAGATMETRTYSKRNGNGSGEEIYQLTLNKERLKIKWGDNGDGTRISNLHFNTLEEARSAFTDQAARLESKGYLDTTVEII